MQTVSRHHSGSYWGTRQPLGGILTSGDPALLSVRCREVTPMVEARSCDRLLKPHVAELGLPADAKDGAAECRRSTF